MVTMPECPMCGTRLVYPDKPKRRSWQAPRGTTVVALVDIRCANYPAVCDVDENKMFVRAFVPNQPLTVRLSR